MSQVVPSKNILLQGYRSKQTFISRHKGPYSIQSPQPTKTRVKYPIQTLLYSESQPENDGELEVCLKDENKEADDASSESENVEFKHEGLDNEDNKEEDGRDSSDNLIKIP